MNKKLLIFLLIILVLTLGIRLTFSLSKKHPAGIDSYYHMRMGQSFPEDNLSYGGRDYFYPPGIHTTLSFINLLIPMPWIAKILPAILAALSVVTVFFLTKQIYNEKIALIASILLSFIPVFLWKTITLMNINFVLFLFPLSALFLINKRKLYLAITATVLAFFSPAMFAVLFILFLLKNRQEKYLIIYFSIIFVILALLWFSSFVNIYFSRSLPSGLKNLLYPSLTFSQILYRLSPFIFLLPIILFVFVNKAHKIEGFFKQFRFFVKKFDKNILIPWTFIFILGFFLIEPDRALSFLSIPLSIFSAKLIFKLQNKRILFFASSISVIFITIFFGILSLNSLSWTVIQPSEYNALYFLRKTPENSTILASEPEGHLITGIGQRKNVMDGNLLNAPNITSRYSHTKRMFQYQNKSLLNKYSIDFVYVSDRTRYYFKNPDQIYSDQEIFFNNSFATIYRLKMTSSS